MNKAQLSRKHYYKQQNPNKWRTPENIIRLVFKEYLHYPDVFFEDESEHSVLSATLTKLMEIVYPPIRASTSRLVIQLKVTGGTGTFYVYKNGVSYASLMLTTSTTYWTRGKNIAGFREDDLLQIYACDDPAGVETCYARNLQIRGESYIRPVPILRPA